MSDNIRIKTTPGGGESLVNLQVNQKFDFIEIYQSKFYDRGSSTQPFKELNSLTLLVL